MLTLGAGILFSDKTIFISPIDWGIGHATRCVPLIRRLLPRNKIIIGVTDLNTFFFSHHFPDLQQVKIPSYNISYSAILPVWLKVFTQWPVIKNVIKQEEKILSQIIKDLKIDVVISDNRFGLRNKNVRSVFVTHQLQVKTPSFESIANKINKKYINAFDEVWVPDYENKNERLSGDLSDDGGIKIPVTYIGPLSLFKKPAVKTVKKYDYLVLLSGVEPQRTILEKIIVQKFRDTSLKLFLVRGSKTKLKSDPGIPVIDFAFEDELSLLIGMSRTVICRSGYSTLMDMDAAGHDDLILVPTPGQPEQEYLAEYWKKKFAAKTTRQKDLISGTFG